MLQRYKEEKELRKQREQREKAKKGVFKVGLYKPTAPGFLAVVPEVPVIAKPREKVIKVIVNIYGKNPVCIQNYVCINKQFIL